MEPYELRRGIKHVKDVRLYPEKLDIAQWYYPHRILHKRQNISRSAEFDERMVRSSLIPAEVWCSTPVSFRIFDLSNDVSWNALEWEKMQAITNLMPETSEKHFFFPWIPILIYEAHHKLVLDVLSPKKDHINTFYVQDGMAVHTLNIELDSDGFIDPTWCFHSWGLGEGQEYANYQRIFVPL